MFPPKRVVTTCMGMCSGSLGLFTNLHDVLRSDFSDSAIAFSIAIDTFLITIVVDHL